MQKENFIATALTQSVWAVTVQVIIHTVKINEGNQFKEICKDYSILFWL